MNHPAKGNSFRAETPRLSVRSQRRWERIVIVIALCALVPLGLWVKYHVSGYFQVWCRDYGAAILYEIFWVFFLRFTSPKTSPRKIALTVFILTCSLEFLQLWRPPWLQWLRSTFLGAAFLGTDFDRWDFLYYALGSMAGYFLLEKAIALARTYAAKDPRV